jgi:hypothetical protein
MPAAVSYARAILYLQASIWGLLCLAGTVSAAEPHPIIFPAGMLAASGVAGALAGTKARLGFRISRGGDVTRRAVVMVESCMACLGALMVMLLIVPGSGLPSLASLVGGGLSLAAAIGLAQPPAKRYFATRSGEVTPAISPAHPDDGGGTLFWHLTPAVPAPGLH